MCTTKLIASHDIFFYLKEDDLQELDTAMKSDKRFVIVWRSNFVIYIIFIFCVLFSKWIDNILTFFQWRVETRIKTPGPGNPKISQKIWRDIQARWKIKRFQQWWRYCKNCVHSALMQDMPCFKQDFSIPGAFKVENYV